MYKFLRFVGIVLLGLTAAFTIMGGAGTTCVALNPTGFGETFAAIAKIQWLYILFVIGTIAIGVGMARATVMLVRGKPHAYRDTALSLVAGVVIGVIHMAVSRSLRGSSMPVDAVTYSAVLTLIVFLLFRLPGLWDKVDFEKAQPKENQRAGGAAAIMAGGLALSIQHWVAATHTLQDGTNYGNAFQGLMGFTGWLLVMSGITLVASTLIRHRLASKRFGHRRVIGRESAS